MAATKLMVIWLFDLVLAVNLEGLLSHPANHRTLNIHRLGSVYHPISLIKEIVAVLK